MLLNSENVNANVTTFDKIINLCKIYNFFLSLRKQTKLGIADKWLSYTKFADTYMYLRQYV